MFCDLCASMWPSTGEPCGQAQVNPRVDPFFIRDPKKSGISAPLLSFLRKLLVPALPACADF